MIFGASLGQIEFFSWNCSAWEEAILMAELEYFRNQSYQEFLLSSARKNLLAPDLVFSYFDWKNPENLVDFGCGLGFYLTEFAKHLPNTWIWAGDCQQDLLDQILRRKWMEELEKVTTFFVERSDHPLLPDWIPNANITFASLSLATFPNPGLAMDGLIRSMMPDGRLFLEEYSKLDTSFGPSINDKISIDKMKFLAEEFKLRVVKADKLNEFFYAMEVVASKEFVFGYYDLKPEEENETI